MSVRLNTSYLAPFVGEHEWKNIAPAVAAAHETLHSRSGAGADFLGWVDLPVAYDKAEFARIQAAGEKIRRTSDVLIVIGIGGSYLGARAVIELLKGQNYNLKAKKGDPMILFVGNSLSPAWLNDILSLCEGKDVAVNVISKSGTTTEPAVAFRVFRKLLMEKYGEKEARERIFVTTDRARGTLKQLADTEGYETFTVPDDVGGRFSVLTAVGLLPIAAAGIDIASLMQGAALAREAYGDPDITKNDCYRYAALRNILLRKGKTNEMLVSFEPSFALMNEWFKQLFGESEGKDNKGLFPVSAIFSTDLHSLGQYIQQGQRLLFETLVDIKKPASDLPIPSDGTDGDGLGFLEGVPMSEVNRKAMEGTVLAHTDGGVPVCVLEVSELSAFETGYLIYFFEKACAVSGYLLGVNPFDQPGVESYKKNMFALLGKPGYESEKAAIEARLQK